ncbi:MAG: hypothetical protein Q7S68_05300 [Deltaproteobacteria bacterium]|nr:hypothetical protein [Deltaproteobacteria bacterium]
MVNQLPITPLSVSDIDLYDTIPDGKLHCNDFVNFHHFLLRYLQTGDRNVRQAFLSVMGNGLWERLGDEIRNMLAVGVTEETVRDRINYILQYEFSENNLHANAEIAHDFERKNQEVFDDFFYSTVHRLTANGDFFLRDPIRQDWLFLLGGALQGSNNTYYLMRTFGPLLFEEDTSFYGSRLRGTTALQKRDDSFQLKIDGEFKKYDHPSHSHLQSSVNVNGSLSLQSEIIPSVPVSAKLSAKYNREEYSAPIAVAGFLPEDHGKLSLDGEIFFRIADFGLALGYDYSDQTDTERVAIDQATRQNISAMLHYTFNQNYLRAGLGLEVWGGNVLFPAGEFLVNYEGAHRYLKVNGHLQLSPPLSLNGSAEVKYRAIDGDYSGVFYGWDSALQLFFNSSQWEGALTLNYHGHQMSLYEFEEKHGTEGEVRVVYRPNDRLRLEVASLGKYSRTEDVMIESKQGELKGSIAFNLPFWERCWLTAYASSLLFSSEDSELSYLSGNDWFAGSQLSIDMTN